MKTPLLLLIFFSLSFVVQAQPGTLDKSFGEDGKVIGTISSGVSKTSLIQPDGKIVVADDCGNVGSMEQW